MAFTAYLGKKMSIFTILWLGLMVECATMVPQVQQQVSTVQTRKKYDRSMHLLQLSLTIGVIIILILVRYGQIKSPRNVEKN